MSPSDDSTMEPKRPDHEGNMFARPHYELSEGDEFWVMVGHTRGANGDEEIYAKIKVTDKRRCVEDE